MIIENADGLRFIEGKILGNATNATTSLIRK